jgi:hypothetical protein
VKKPNRKYCIDVSGLQKLACGMTRNQAMRAALVKARELKREVWIMRGMGGHLTTAGVCNTKRCAMSDSR